MSSPTYAIVCQIRAIAEITVSHRSGAPDEALAIILDELKAAVAKVKEEQDHRTFWKLHDGDAA